MTTRSIGWALLFLLPGCAATVTADDMGDPPGGSATASSAPVPIVPTSDASAESSSVPHFAEPGSSVAITPNPKGKADGAPCSKSDDCQSGVCEGEGCDPATTKAVCAAQNRMCTRDYVTYCGCDGKEFGTSGSCAGRIYKNKGSCK